MSKIDNLKLFNINATLSLQFSEFRKLKIRGLERYITPSNLLKPFSPSQYPFTKIANCKGNSPLVRYLKLIKKPTSSWEIDSNFYNDFGKLTKKLTQLPFVFLSCVWEFIKENE